MDRLGEGGGGWGEVVWEIWKKYPTASQAKKKVHAWPALRKKKSCMHGAAKEKNLTNH